MLNDKITLKDLSVFSSDEGSSIFGLLSNTTTQAGKDMLRRHIQKPPATYEQLQQMQDVIKYFSTHMDKWPSVITNGTLVMLEKFFDAADAMSSQPAGFSLVFGQFFQKYFNKGEYFFTQFSLSHLSDFLKGCMELVKLLSEKELPEMLRRHLESMQQELQHRLTDELVQIDKHTPFRELAKLSYKARREMKSPTFRLIDAYAKLDAWQAMANAGSKHGWVFPQLLSQTQSVLEATDFYHPLLQQPVPYTIALSGKKNFLLLTGANMSGKTTFMRALGVGALLAHLGMAVPAKAMQVSFLEGVITNMHVEDNIIRGESYFFAEVQRMKLTAQQLQNEGSRLVLMDELFKGTNVHDAYECTRAVINGLLNHPHHLMILSTHLYEVAQHFSNNESIRFAYFETEMREGEQFHFTYRLKEGISNDRIGYRILQQQGVLSLLDKSKTKG